MDRSSEIAFLHPWPALEHAARAWPDADALVFPHQNEKRSFLAWHTEALRVAGALKSLGLGTGDHVALLAENRIEWPVVQMACVALGAVFVPLNTHYRKDDLAYALKQSDARALICSTAYRSNPFLDNVMALRDELPMLAHVLPLEADYSRLAAHEPLDVKPAHKVDAVGALLYTSGTTGFPKGALLSHRAMMMVAGSSAGAAWSFCRRSVDFDHSVVSLRGVHSQCARLSAQGGCLCRCSKLRS